MASASAAIPARMARNPHERPMTSTMKARLWARAVSEILSQASTMVLTAVSTPMASSPIRSRARRCPSSVGNTLERADPRMVPPKPEMPKTTGRSSLM